MKKNQFVGKTFLEQWNFVCLTLFGILAQWLAKKVCFFERHIFGTKVTVSLTHKSFRVKLRKEGQKEVKTFSFFSQT